MSAILDSIKSTINSNSHNFPIINVAAYANCTTLKTKRLGISMTLNDDRIFPTRIRSNVNNMGKIEQMDLEEILSWTDSPQGIERSFAMAAINSAIDLDQKYFAGNALEITQILGKNKNVTVVGHFPNMIEIAKASANFTVLEKRPQEGDRPAEDAAEIIPNSDIVTITGVTCLNDTIEGLLALKKAGSIFIVLGSSVPLSSVLFDFGVDIIGGAWVENEEKAIAKLSQGGTTRHVDEIRNVLMTKDESLLKGYQEVLPPIR